MPELLKTKFIKSPNLKAYYRFETLNDNTAMDETGAYNLTGEHSPTLTTGKWGSSLSASNDAIVKTTSSLGLNPQNFSISCWVKSNSNNQSGNFIYIGTTYAIGFGQGDEYGDASNYINVFVNNNGSVDINRFGVEFPDQTNFHHIVITKDSTIYKLYINGIFRSYTLTVNLTQFGSGLIIGDASHTASFDIDDVALFDKCLSGDEVVELYRGNEFATNELQYKRLRTDSSLKAYYKCDSFNSNTLIDETGTYNMSGVYTPILKSGKFGNSLSVSSGQYTEVSSVMGLTNNNWSVSLWVKSNSNSQSSPFIWVGTGSDGWAIYQSDNGSSSNGNYISIALASTMLATGVQFPDQTNFHHVVVTRDTTTTRLYLNGEYKFGDSTTSIITPTTSIGLGWSGSHDFDDVAIFNRCLSPNEVFEIYSNRSYGSYTPTPNTVLYMPLNGNLTDYSGNNNHGQIVGSTVVYNNDGIFGKCVYFDASLETYITTQNSMTCVSDYTISFWFKSDDSTGRKIIGMENQKTGTSSTDYSPFVALNSQGKIEMLNYDGSTVNHAYSDNALNDGTWHHVVVVQTNSTPRKQLVYINGFLNDEVLNSIDALYSYSGYWKIGGYKGYGVSAYLNDGYYDGSLNEVIIENRVWTAKMVRDYYNTTKGRYLPKINIL